MAEFQVILKNLLSSENEVRKLAEESYEQIDKNQRVKYLLLTAKNAECEEENRQMCLVLLRRLLSSDWEEIWKKWSPEDKLSFCSELFMSAQSSTDETMRKRFCDILAEVARNCIDDDEKPIWEQMLNFVFNCAKSDAVNHKEIAMHMIENVPGIFGEEPHKYVEVVKSILTSALQDKEMGLKIAAVRAASAFLCFSEGEKALLKHFVPLVPEILKVTFEAAEKEESDAPLECLTEMATSVPKMMRHNLSDICTMCLKIVSDVEKEDCYRHSALEVLVTLSESSAAMIRKEAAKFIPDIIQQCLGLMVQVEDEDDWDDVDEYTDEDVDSNASVGETSLDRLACSLGGKSVLQPVLRIVQPMMHHENWKHRYAGLMALSAIGEGCHQQMEHVLEQVLAGVIQFLTDAHPRVRFAACNALGQMSTDFSPVLQKKYAEKVVPALLSVLDNLSCPRVAANAAAALVNFSEDAPKSVVLAYLEKFMTKFQQVLQDSMQMMVQHKRKIVLEQIITTIASVADTAEEGFAPYYDGVMPCLKYILEHIDGAELKLLRGKTIECVSLIGLAVGKEKFLPDANHIMQLLLKTQTEMGSIEAEDPQVSYMISAWTRICRLMGTDFQQYLPLVMPAVMKTASFKPEVTILDSDEANDIDAEDDWEFVRLGEQQSFGIKTAGLEDKATACEMLVCYARELKGAFSDYVEEVTKLMVPLLKFYFHDGVRTAAAESLPYLLESAKAKGPQFVAEMWKFIFPELLKAVESDPENEVLAEHMWSLAKCIECLGVGCLGDQEMRQIVGIIEERFKKHFEKSSEREDLRKDEDYDEEVEHDLKAEHEDDALLLSKISDIFHALFLTFKENTLPYFELLLPHIAKLLDPRMPIPERQWGICFYDDAVEFGGVGAVKYLQTFLEPMILGLSDEAPEIRQASSYGFGVMGMYGGNLYAQACAQAIPHIIRMIDEPTSRNDTANRTATENGIAAVAKILKFNNSMVDAAQLISAFVSWLPIWEDDEELPHVYNYFCDLIESSHPLVVGDSHANLPHLVKIIAQAFARNKFAETEDTIKVAHRMCNIVKEVQANPQAAMACSANLNQEECEALSQMMAKF